MIVTTEAKLKDKAFNTYLEERSKEESRIILYTYQQLKRHDFEEVYGSTSKLNSHISKKFDILTREANSTIHLVSSAIESYLALKEFELKDKKERLGGVRGKLRKRKIERSILKQKAAENRLNRKGFRRLKNVKQSIYRLQNKVNELKQDIKKLKRIVKNGEVHIGFGTKKLFKKQFNLTENGYQNHQEWKEDFRRVKSHYILSVGRAAENGGNQITTFSIDPENGTLTLRYRKSHPKKGESKYIYCRNIVLKFLKDEFYYLLRHPKSKAVTVRFLKRKRDWYVQITFDLDCPPVSTDSSSGVISLDYNHNFIQQGEVDGGANLVGLKKHNLLFHGQGNRATNEIRETVKGIVKEAGIKGKSIACEDLSFTALKARNSKYSNSKKRVRKITSVLDYRRYSEALERCCRKNGVGLIKVPACFTTKNAKEWWCPKRKLNSHQGSCVTIARRAMQLSDLGPNQLI